MVARHGAIRTIAPHARQAWLKQDKKTSVASAEHARAVGVQGIRQRIVCAHGKCCPFTAGHDECDEP